MAMVYYANKESLDIIVVRNQNEVCRMLLDLLYCKLWKPEQASEPHLLNLSTIVGISISDILSS